MQSTSPEVTLQDAAVHPLSAAEPSPAHAAMQTAFPILAMLSVCHLLNDMIQSLLPAIYPMLKDSFELDFGQIGLITLTFQVTASLLQPLVGIYTDRSPMPYSLRDRHGLHAVRACCCSRMRRPFRCCCSQPR